LSPPPPSRALRRAASLASEIRRELLLSYDSGRRDLPWREATDPYRIWVSEVMLQQTRVETVLPYYKEWMVRFPDLEALATADEDEVLRAWQGLGYYSRARRLWGGAKVVRERFKGRLPESMEELRSLPGVGEYTAGAVASIAYGEVVPAVDGNVRRVLSRLFDLPDPTAGELRALARELVDPVRPGDFNQALMEHGALICSPRSPTCAQCSLEGLCRASEMGTVGGRPRKRVRQTVPELHFVVLVAVRSDESAGRARGPRFLLRKRPETGLLAGLWEFPGVEMKAIGAARLPDRVPHEVEAQLARVASELGVDIPLAGTEDPVPLQSVPHQFSHLKAVYWPWLVRMREGGGDQGRWVGLEEIEELPLPVAQGKILRLALDTLGVGVPPQGA
jgi:A/G-specific adenine glycosylase